VPALGGRHDDDEAHEQAVEQGIGDDDKRGAARRLEGRFERERSRGGGDCERADRAIEPRRLARDAARAHERDHAREIAEVQPQPQDVGGGRERRRRLVQDGLEDDPACDVEAPAGGEERPGQALGRHLDRPQPAEHGAEGEDRPQVPVDKPVGVHGAGHVEDEQRKHSRHRGRDRAWESCPSESGDTSLVGRKGPELEGYKATKTDLDSR
jgi:hypothetical protein